MSADVYGKIAEQLRDVEGKIKIARDYISTARIAGEDTNALEAQVRELEKRALGWKSALRAKGY